MAIYGRLTLTLSANAATVKPAAAQASTSAAQNSVDRLTPANSTDGIIALVNENAILKSELVDAIEQTQARAKAAGEPIANSAQLQSEVLNALILRELQLSMVKRAGLSADEAEINQRLGQIAQAEGLNSIAALQQRLDAAQPGSYANLRAKLIEEASIQALQQRQITRRVRISEQDIDAFLASPEAKRLNQSEYQTIHVRVPYIDDYSRLSAAQREEALKVAQALRTRLLEPNVNVAEAVAASQGSYPIPLQGGDMGFHKAASLPTELSSKITKLDVGTVSEPLLTPEGIDIIKLADKKASNTMLIPQWHTRHILVKVDDLQTDALAEQKN
ncbi:peptidylprolyl isomerase [Psychrobacter sp. JCM 18900]|uniref:peptidylprolyl isomerase n=1 Tax=Psychrobacter sp. JCM 18900 TaxID=1298608 RepID=UPI00351C10AC